jgi:hypothetical protein
MMTMMMMMMMTMMMMTTMMMMMMMMFCQHTKPNASSSCVRYHKNGVYR